MRKVTRTKQTQDIFSAWKSHIQQNHAACVFERRIQSRGSFTHTVDCVYVIFKQDAPNDLSRDELQETVVSSESCFLNNRDMNTPY